MKRSLLLISLAASCLGHAQDTTYCDPSIEGTPLAKGIEFTYDRLMDYGITGNSDVEALGNVNGEVRRNRRLRAAIRLPAWNKPNFKLIIGARYEREQYSFEAGTFETSPVLQNVDRLPLARTSVSFLAVKPFKGDKYLLLRGKSAVNRNLDGGLDIAGSSLKYSAALMLGWRRNDRTVLGLGASLGYNLGRAALAPVILYTHMLQHDWGLQVVLPVLVQVHHHLSEKDLLLLKGQLKGANYDLEMDLGEGPRTFYLERSELHTTLRYEREIHDWLWLGLEAGVRYGLELNIVDDFGLGQGDEIFSGNVRPAALVSGGLFMVTPKKWRK